MGELHLDIIRSRLEKEYKLEVDLGPLQIAYRETIEDSAGEDQELVTSNLPWLIKYFEFVFFIFSKFKFYRKFKKKKKQ